MTKDEAKEILKDHNIVTMSWECENCGTHMSLDCTCGYNIEREADAESIQNHILDVLFDAPVSQSVEETVSKAV